MAGGEKMTEMDFKELREGTMQELKELASSEERPECQNEIRLARWEHEIMMNWLGAVIGRLGVQRKEQKFHMVVSAFLQAATVVMLILLTLKAW